MSYFSLDRHQLLADPEPCTAANVQWEEINCPLCRGSHWDTLLEAPDRQGGTALWFAVVQCHDCGLCFTNPRPKKGSLAKFYPRDYRPHETTEEKSSNMLRSVSRRLWPQRPPIPWHGEGRLLDFGCGGGTFLKRMHDRGWQATGVDSSPQAVRRAREATHVKVLLGSFPHEELKPASFDAITMWHSFEHVPNPGTVLREANRLLTPGGKLFVAVPNIDSLAFRVFGQAWAGLDLPRHLTHFAPSTLHIMLKRAGFSRIRIRMDRRSARLRDSARIACQSPQAGATHRWLRGKPVSRLVAFYSCLTNQSDCMTATAEAKG